MSRSVLKRACIASGILFVFFGVWTVFSVAAGAERIKAAGGIIGGADAPTLIFLLQSSRSFYAALAALLLFVGTGLTLVLWKKPKA